MKKQKHKRIDLIALEKSIDEALENATPEEFYKIIHKNRDEKLPKGWVDINHHLPMCLAMDFITKGYSTYRVKDNNGKEFETHLADSIVWKVDVAEPLNITHWWNS